MSRLESIVLASAPSFGITACNSKHNSALMGNSADKTNVNKGSTNISSPYTAKSSGTNSTVHGNAPPTEK